MSFKFTQCFKPVQAPRSGLSFADNFRPECPQWRTSQGFLRMVGFWTALCFTHLHCHYGIHLIHFLFKRANLMDSNYGRKSCSDLRVLEKHTMSIRLHHQGLPCFHLNCYHVLGEELSRLRGFKAAYFCELCPPPFRSVAHHHRCSCMRICCPSRNPIFHDRFVL